MMKKFDDLAHIPPKYHDKISDLVRRCNGSSKILAEKMSASLVNKLKNDHSAAIMEEGFDPKVSVEEILVTKGIKGIDALMASRREQSFQEFSDIFKDLIMDGTGEIYAEISDGFTNGEEGALSWTEKNLQAHNTENLPPNMVMIANMKTQ